MNLQCKVHLFFSKYQKIYFLQKMNFLVLFWKVWVFYLKEWQKSTVKTILTHFWSLGGFYQEQVDSYSLKLPAFGFYWLPCSRLCHYKSSLERQPVAEGPCTRLHVCLVGVVAKSKSTHSGQFSRLLALSEMAMQTNQHSVGLTQGHIHSLPSFLPGLIFLSFTFT